MEEKNQDGTRELSEDVSCSEDISYEDDAYGPTSFIPLFKELLIHNQVNEDLRRWLCNMERQEGDIFNLLRVPAELLGIQERPYYQQKSYEPIRSLYSPAALELESVDVAALPATE